jgi:hypothetical protein
MLLKTKKTKKNQIKYPPPHWWSWALVTHVAWGLNGQQMHQTELLLVHGNASVLSTSVFQVIDLVAEWMGCELRQPSERVFLIEAFVVGFTHEFLF